MARSWGKSGESMEGVHGEMTNPVATGSILRDLHRERQLHTHS
jgi:hypothetical protein